MKSIESFVNTLILCFFIALLAAPVYGQQPSKYALLWQISGNGLKSPSYLFGSAHVKDSRAFQFSDSVMLALEACELFAMEIHPDSAVKHTLAYRRQAKLQPEKHQLTAAQQTEVMERYESVHGHVPDSSILGNPFLIEDLMRPHVPKPDDRVSTLDAYLLGIAHTLHKIPRGLEEVDDLLTKLWGEKSISGLFTADHSEYESMTEQVLSAYGVGDLDKVWSIIGPYAVADTTLIRRNREMTESIIRLTGERSLFAVAGVAHLPGENGIIALLKDAGYTVRSVEATFTGVADRYAVDASKMQWHSIKDSINHFQIDLPPGHFHTERVGRAITLQHFELANESELYVIARPVGPSGSIDPSEHLEQELNLRLAAKNVSMLERRFFTVSGIPALEMVMRVGRGYERTRVLLRDNIQHTLTLLHTSEKIDPTFAPRFFDSFTPLPVTPRASQQTVFRHPAGAFEIQFPFAPEENVTEVKDPSFPDYEPLKIHFFSALDNEKDMFYVVRYNDFPPGLYLMDKDHAIGTLIQLAAAQGELIGSPTTVIRAGLVGKAAAIKTNEDILMEMEVFTRGNRLYLLMRNSIYGVQPLDDNHFFRSFDILPFDPPAFHPVSLGTLATEVPGTPVIQNTQPEEIGAHVSTMGSAFSVDPHSGTLYGIETMTFSPHAKFIADTFYRQIMDGMLQAGDSLIVDMDITIEQQAGKEYRTIREASNIANRIRMWLNGDSFHILQTLGDAEQLHSPTTNWFFDQARSTPVNPDFDLYASKAEAIMRDLRSTDTTVLSEAREALHAYYPFDSTETRYLREALRYSYADDDSAYRNTKQQLIRELATLRDRESVPALKRIFDDENTSVTVKAAVIAHITTIDSTTFDWYFDALTNRPPVISTGGYELFYPLFDSLPHVATHLHRLLPLLSIDAYRPNVLSISSRVSDKNTPVGQQSLLAAKVPLTQYALVDLDTFLHVLEQPDDYPNYGVIYNYLNILPSLDTVALVQAFTEPLLQLDDDHIQVQVSAVAARIRAGVSVDEALLHARMEDLRTRRELLEAFHRIGQLDRVPAVYLTSEALATLALHEYVYDYDEYPESISLLGQLAYEEDLYHVFEWTWLDYEGDTFHYIGISKTIDVAFTDGLLTLYPCFTDYEPIDEETVWQVHAEKLIEQMRE